jgi:1,4-alpha-glucan branching enzyme
MFKFYQDLIRLRSQHPGLRSLSLSTVYVHQDNRVLAFLRSDGADRYLVVASLNNAGFAGGYWMPTGGLGAGSWREVLNSDAAIYGGGNVGNGGALLSSSDAGMQLVIPANGLLVLQEQ